MKTIVFIILSLSCASLFSQRQLGTDTIRMEVSAVQAKTIVDTNVGNSDFIIIDVRTPLEYGPAHIANAINIDYNSPTFSAQINALDHNKMYLVHCAGGSRSPKARDSMIVKHFREIYHMYNGINAWINAGYPTVSGYTVVKENSDAKNIKLFVNPESEILNILYTANKSGKIIITDLQGKLVLVSDITKGTNQFSLLGLPTGVYIVNIKSSEKNYTKKIFVR